MALLRDGRLGSDTSNNAISEGVDMLSDLAAIEASKRYPLMVIFVASEESMYYWDEASVLAPAPPSVVKPDDITLPDAGRWIAFGGGGGGSPSTVEFVKVAFTHATASPLFLTSLSAGQVVVDAEIIIETAFNDPAATLHVGVDADNDDIIPDDQNLPSQVGIYASRANVFYAVNDTVRIWINKGASTQGAGYVVLEIKRG